MLTWAEGYQATVKEAFDGPAAVCLWDDASPWCEAWWYGRCAALIDMNRPDEAIAALVDNGLKSKDDAIAHVHHLQKTSA